MYSQILRVLIGFSIIILLIILEPFVNNHIAMALNSADDFVLQTPPPNQHGWPKNIAYTQERLFSEVIVADVDGDGQKDIVFSLLSGYNSMIYVQDINGNNFSQWPVSADPAQPIVGDIDNDGTMEIFSGSMGFYSDATPIPGWPRKPVGCEYSEIKVSSIIDLNNDGEPEIIGYYPRGLKTQDFENPCYIGAQIYVWNKDGELLPDMPIKLPFIYQYFGAVGSSDIYVPPKASDLDGDGTLELIAVGFSANERDYIIYAWDLNGQMLEGWPVHLGKLGDFKYFSYFSIGDVNNDGRKEIIIANMENNAIYVINSDGTILNSWSAENGVDLYPDVTLGNLDSDPNLEMIFVTKNRSDPNSSKLVVNVCNAEDGTSLEGWPRGLTSHYLTFFVLYDALFRWIHTQPVPILADINNDNLSEILIPLSFGNRVHIFAFTRDGENAQGFPYELPDTRFTNSLFADDIDLDGDLDVGLLSSTDVSNQTYLNIWDMDTPFNEYSNEWPFYGHDVKQTFQYSSLEERCEKYIAQECSDSGFNCHEFCLEEFCGNGTIDFSVEQCDDGNRDNFDHCNNSCLLNFCGDGVVNNDEQCDDGNLTSYDGCSELCQIENDLDADGVSDKMDNCLLVPNGLLNASNQIDADRDGYGNSCDADYNNDNIVNVFDWFILQRAYFSRLGNVHYNPKADFNGDDWIDRQDLLFFYTQWNKQPGPSGYACAYSRSCFKLKIKKK